MFQFSALRPKFHNSGLECHQLIKKILQNPDASVFKTFILTSSSRFAFKLAYDQAVLGEADDFDEISEYIQQYDTEYYFGRDNDPEWAESVQQGIPQLFSLLHDSSEVKPFTPFCYLHTNKIVYSAASCVSQSHKFVQCKVSLC